MLMVLIQNTTANYAIHHCSFIQIQLASQQRQDKGLEAEAT